MPSIGGLECLAGGRGNAAPGRKADPAPSVTTTRQEEPGCHRVAGDFESPLPLPPGQKRLLAPSHRTRIKRPATGSQRPDKRTAGPAPGAVRAGPGRVGNLGCQSHGQQNADQGAGSRVGESVLACPCPESACVGAPRAPGPDIVFPADCSWLLSRLWDDDWRCLGGPSELLDRLVSDGQLDARRVSLTQDATPPGHVAY